MDKFNANVGQRISQQQRDEMIVAFEAKYPGATNGNHFSAECFKDLLSLPNAACIVTTFGCDESGAIKCIHAACDIAGNYLRDENGDIISYEIGGACPPYCPV